MIHFEFVNLAVPNEKEWVGCNGGAMVVKKQPKVKLFVWLAVRGFYEPILDKIKTSFSRERKRLPLLENEFDPATLNLMKLKFIDLILFV